MAHLLNVEDEERKGFAPGLESQGGRTGTELGEGVMSLKSLVLCADEKIVRVLRRVLSDLEIGIEHCTDPDGSPPQTHPPEI